MASAQISACLADISSWIMAHQLKLNEGHPRSFIPRSGSFKIPDFPFDHCSLPWTINCPFSCILLIWHTHVSFFFITSKGFDHFYEGFGQTSCSGTCSVSCLFRPGLLQFCWQLYLWSSSTPLHCCTPSTGFCYMHTSDLKHCCLPTKPKINQHALTLKPSSFHA